MDRRQFVRIAGLSLLAAPLAAEAQQAGKVYRIGVLTLYPIDPSRPEISGGFLRGLRERGWVDGHNITLVYGNAGGRAERSSLP